MTRTTMHTLDNSRTVPAFLSKLWNLVEDPATNDTICWSKNGKMVVIKDEIKFCFTLLPIYYKHNNMSSFIRQLNMYGFRKIPNSEFSEIKENFENQFGHPYFQKGKLELLKCIKRKVTGSKIATSTSLGEDTHNFSEIHSDVKSLYNRQKQVDSILNNLKQENAVLWRELAVLRQKHQKQQQIVNKLIQFLVTMVQPSSRLGGVRAFKRRPLMLGSAPKKKKTNSEGPTIHELDTTEQHLDNLNTVDDFQIESPASSSGQNQDSSVVNVEEIDIDQDASTEPNLEPVDELFSDLELPEENNTIPMLEIPEPFEGNSSVKIADAEPNLLDSTSQDTLLASLINGSYNYSDPHYSNIKKENTLEQNCGTNDMSIATCGSSSPNPWLNTCDELNSHVGITQSQLDEIKKIFNGCNSVDAKYLLQLFNEVPSYGLTPNDTWDTLESSEATASGTEVTPYDPPLIDFNELLDDLDSTELNTSFSLNESDNHQLN